MKLKIYLFFMLLFSSLGVIGQELSLEQLYFRYNPKNTSLTTQHLIANEYINQTGLNIRGASASIFRSNGNGAYDYSNPNNKMLRKSNKDFMLDTYRSSLETIQQFEEDNATASLLWSGSKFGASIATDVISGGLSRFKSVRTVTDKVSPIVKGLGSLFKNDFVREGLSYVGQYTDAGKTVMGMYDKAKNYVRGSNDYVKLAVTALGGPDFNGEELATERERIYAMAAKAIAVKLTDPNGNVLKQADALVAYDQIIQEAKASGNVKLAGYMEVELKKGVLNQLGDVTEYVAANKQAILEAKEDRALIRQEVKESLVNLENKFNDKLNTVVMEFQESFDVLYQNDLKQLEINKDIYNHLANNQEAIQNLGGQLKSFMDQSAKINDIQNQAIGELADIAQEHRQKISENQAGIGILMQDFLFRQSPEQLQKFLDSDDPAVKNVIDRTPGLREDLVEHKENLEQDQSLMNISKKLSHYQGYANLTFEALTTFGILKGEDAKKVGKVMWYANKGINVANLAISAVRAGAGDPTAYISLGLEALSIIQGPGGDQPSELQIVLEQMNERFDIVEEKLDSLTSLVIRSHESLSEQIQANKDFTLFVYNKIDLKLDEILEKQNDLLSLTRSILFQGVNRCDQLEQARTQSEITLQKYSDFELLYNSNSNACKACMEGIQTIASGDINFVSLDYARSEYLTQLVLNGYRPVADLFKSFYASDLEQATNILNIPHNEVQQNQYAYLFLKDIEGIDVGTHDANGSTLDEDVFISHQELAKYVDLYQKYFPFLEMGDEDFRPRAIEDFLSRSELESKATLISRRLEVETLLRFTRMAIAQQTLIAGNLMLDPIYYTIFQGQNCEKRYDSYYVIQNNTYFNHNFSVYLMRKNLNMDSPYFNRNIDSTRFDLFQQYYDEVMINGNTNFIQNIKDLFYVDNLNIQLQNGQLVMVLPYDDAQSPSNCRSEENPFTVILKVPSPSEIELNQMEYPKAISSLKQTEGKLKELQSLFKQSLNYSEDWFAQQQYKTQMVNELLNQNENE